jgi:hypothetical protein
LPGFLEAAGYDGTEKIILFPGYWAEVKRCLTAQEKALVDDLLGGRQRVDVAGKRQYAELNYTASRTEMVVWSLVDWNIDTDGQVWPLDGVTNRATGKTEYPPGCLRRQSLARLPGPVFDMIWRRCDELNTPPTGEEAATFPDPADGSDPDGDTGPAGPPAVPDGTSVLAGPGPDPGDPGGPPAS